MFGDAGDGPAMLRGEIETGDEGGAMGISLDNILADVARRAPELTLRAVGHRVVHGGADHIAPEAVTPALLRALHTLAPLDPLHMPRNLAPIAALAARHPALPQVACFDTAFHHTLPPVAQRFGLPRAMTEAGLRRYGFHGLSYEYIARQLAKVAPGLRRVVVAHLGSGASLCALRDGRSIATTTGFSALDGLLMATRCGSLDPGVILHLGRAGKTFAEIEALLYHQCGLLGVSGISGDIRVLMASAAPEAREAIELFTYRIALDVAGMATALGGIDGLVFTAGIGEHAAPVRAAVCERLAWLGLGLDAEANAAGAPMVSNEASRVAIHVIATDEEAMVAQHTRAVIAWKDPP
nr:acetate kinase [Plastoroseomonas arctica]